MDLLSIILLSPQFLFFCICIHIASIIMTTPNPPFSSRACSHRVLYILLTANVSYFISLFVRVFELKEHTTSCVAKKVNFVAMYSNVCVCTTD